MRSGGGAQRTLLLLVGLTLAAGGCSGGQEELSGDLSSLPAPSQSADPVQVVATATVPEPGAAAFDEPDGLTVGRLQPGTYEVAKQQSGWLLVFVPTEEEPTRTVWVPASGLGVSPDR